MVTSLRAINADKKLYVMGVLWEDAQTFIH